MISVYTLLTIIRVYEHVQSTIKSFMTVLTYSFEQLAE